MPQRAVQTERTVAEPMATIEAHGLRKAFGTTVALDSIDLRIEEGRILGLVGPNGSGKSTLIRMMAGLLRPKAGRILLDGVPFDDCPPRLRAREIAYVPQSTATAFPFQVIDLVLSGRTPHTPRFRFESARDSEKAMESLVSRRRSGYRRGRQGGSLKDGLSVTARAGISLP